MRHAVRTLQRALGVAVDGGRVEDHRRSRGNASAHRRVRGRRAAYYRACAGFDRFGEGWLARNARCAALAAQWLAEGAAA